MDQLLAMGFPEETAKAALEAHGNDLARSLDALLSSEPASTQSSSPEVVQASISQYDVENGRSACTCICLEASVSILEQMAKGLWTGSPDDVANIVSIGVVMYEAVAGAGTLTTEHTSVSEILPVVTRYNDLLEPATAKVYHQGVLGSDMSIAAVLEGIRRERQGNTRPTAVIITKPPETVVAFLPADIHEHSSGVTTTSDSSQQWLLFDSHPRPHLGLVGASVRSFGSEVALVEALTTIFPALDLGTDSVSANMYNMIDCTPMRLKEVAEP